MLPPETIEEKIRETYELGGNQILLQGGHNPDLKIDVLRGLFQPIEDHLPDLWLHALSPPEITHIRKVSRLTLAETLERLHAAGLDSIPGGGAEILVDSGPSATRDEQVLGRRVARGDGTGSPARGCARRRR